MMVIFFGYQYFCAIQQLNIQAKHLIFLIRKAEMQIFMNPRVAFLYFSSLFRLWGSACPNLPSNSCLLGNIFMDLKESVSIGDPIHRKLVKKKSMFPA